MKGLFKGHGGAVFWHAHSVPRPASRQPCPWRQASLNSTVFIHCSIFATDELKPEFIFFLKWSSKKKKTKKQTRKNSHHHVLQNTFKRYYYILTYLGLQLESLKLHRTEDQSHSVILYLHANSLFFLLLFCRSAKQKTIEALSLLPFG